MKYNNINYSLNQQKKTMGIKGLNNLLRKFDIFEEISISEYAYKIVAIDTSLYVYKYKFAAGERWLT